ncbi:perlucin-like [Mytilus californianus]|uniref:perlucin-like n=1 Tax=Mytilus californianus TaxID=6549 RepID=UPI002246659B|nr:perlucin-like [Mytilus californianus]
MYRRYNTRDVNFKCPKGWAEFRGECLLFSPEKKNWFEAHDTCRSHQAYLATDDSAEKHSFMKKILSILDGFRNFFIGATDLVFEGQWLWVESGTAQKGYTAWGPGKPDNNASLSIKKNCLMCYLDELQILLMPNRFSAEDTDTEIGYY